MTPNEFQRLKDRIRGLEHEAVRAKGSMDQLMETMKREFGCDAIGDAERLLKTLEKEIAKDERQLDKDWKWFENKWEGKLT